MGFLALIYGVISYVLFFAAFLYIIVFVGGDALPLDMFAKTIDAGTSPLSWAPAVLVNIGLLMLFGLQHTIMARQGFKKAMTKIIPWSIERSTYVLLTAIILFAIYTYWVPMPGVVWSITSPAWSMFMLALFFVGIGIVLLSTFLIDHFELFGLSQVWHRFKGKELPKPEFRTPLFYKNVRHPLYLGWIIFFWATPHMTVGHLVFASVWTIYIFVAIGYEERDLTRLFGDRYRNYVAKVPMIIPFGKSKD